MNKPRRNFHRAEKRALLILGSVALFVRGLFFNGLYSSFDFQQGLRVVTASHLLQSGSLATAFNPARVAIGGFQDLLFYLPYLVLQWLGLDGFKVLYVPLLLSIGSISLLYAISRRLLGPNAAYITTLLVVFLPLDIFYASSSLATAQVVFLFLLAAWAAITLWEKRTWLRIVLLVISTGGLLVWHPWLLLTLVLVLCFWFNLLTGDSRWLVGGMLLITASMGLTGTVFGSNFVFFYNFLQAQPESLLLLPLFLVSVTVLATDSITSARFPLLLIAAAFAIAIAHASRSNAFPALLDSSSLGVFLLLIFYSFSMLAGLYLSRNFNQEETIRWGTRLAIFCLVAALLAVWGGRIFLPSLKDWGWLSFASLFPFFSILGGIGFFAIMVSPWLLLHKSNWAKMAIWTLLSILVLANLSFTWQRIKEFSFYSHAIGSAVEYIQAQDMKAVYTPDEKVYQAMEVYSQAAASIQLIDFTETEEIPFGYVLVFDDVSEDIPSTWVQESEFGDLGKPRLVLYQVATPDEAQELAESETGLAQSSALINAGLYCQGYRAWVAVFSNEIGYVRTDPHSECFTKSGNLTATEDLTLGQNISSYITFDFPQVSEDETPILSIYQISLPILNMATTGVTLLLEPNSNYLYSVDIKTTAPTATLYWSGNDQEDYLEMRSYPDWTTVSILLKTPKWDTAQPIYFAPALFDHIETVNLRNFYLGQVNLIEQAP